MDEQIALIPLIETTPVRPERKKKKKNGEIPEFREMQEASEKRKSLKQRLAIVKSRITRIDTSVMKDFTDFLRPRFRNVNCFKVEEDELPVLPHDTERHRSIDFDTRRSSVNFFRRKTDCQHPYHPYKPKQFTRLVWQVKHT